MAHRTTTLGLTLLASAKRLIAVFIPRGTAAWIAVCFAMRELCHKSAKRVKYRI
jgi:hypothetical protein